MRILLGILAMGLAFAAEPVLVIGDSISVGYTPVVTTLLAGKADVKHNEGNAAHTNNGVAKLEEWLGETNWTGIPFKFGLHGWKT